MGIAWDYQANIYELHGSNYMVNTCKYMGNTCKYMGNTLKPSVLLYMVIGL